MSIPRKISIRTVNSNVFPIHKKGVKQKLWKHEKYQMHVLTSSMWKSNVLSEITFSCYSTTICRHMSLFDGTVQMSCGFAGNGVSCWRFFFIVRYFWSLFFKWNFLSLCILFLTLVSISLIVSFVGISKWQISWLVSLWWGGVVDGREWVKD